MRSLFLLLACLGCESLGQTPPSRSHRIDSSKRRLHVDVVGAGHVHGTSLPGAISWRRLANPLRGKFVISKKPDTRRFLHVHSCSDVEEFHPKSMPSTNHRLSCTRKSIFKWFLFVSAMAITSLPSKFLQAAENSVSSPQLRDLIARMQDETPRQQLSDVLTPNFGSGDRLTFPPWMEGRWEVTSNPVANTAPLGRRYLPKDVSKMKLGDLTSASVPPLSYEVRFARRLSDGAIVSDRAANLRAVQNAAAGFSRVATVSFDGESKVSVTYSPTGRNGSFVGRSRAEVFINYRKQSAPRADLREFAFAEGTRTVLISQQQSLALDAETLCLFERAADDDAGKSVVHARQRVLRFLTPNPNSEEGVLWGEAGGRAVALLDYKLRLVRIGDADPEATKS
eukprot:gnl/TRDRNA2_/TRDRNA2_44140_c0_seq1.p1 gnl/TRDRNA2_/TRDRNA2_44140_c0~~gnl/TRDRNA2_/TRDRNA2_44140_c0_seq1.p1  ORF type:complete len:396 (+),score=17.21 gnl/TRDRNA2_/TRDRNA2_44140_c0_seq1:23-1210(+)